MTLDDRIRAALRPRGIMTRDDLKILEEELSSHLYDMFAPALNSGIVPDGFDERVKEELSQWREEQEEKGRLPLVPVVRFECHLHLHVGGGLLVEPPRFEVTAVLQDLELSDGWDDGWDDDPLEL